MSDYSINIGASLINFFTFTTLADLGPVSKLVALIQQWQNGELDDSGFANQVQNLADYP